MRQHRSDLHAFMVPGVSERRRYQTGVSHRDTKNAVSEGLLGFQMHTGPPFTVQFRHIQLREL